MLEMFKIIIDHKILLRRSGLRRTGKKMKGCSTKKRFALRYALPKRVLSSMF